MPRCDRSAVFDDLDGDGDVDVVVSELNGPIRILRNPLAVGDRWLTLELSDERAGVGNRHAVGASVEFSTSRWSASRWALGGGPYQSNWSPMMPVGLPEGGEVVSFTVRWPDGVVSEHRSDPGRRLVLRRIAPDEFVLSDAP